ncbi:TIGR00730 family Rossman fold protein [Ktedonosporobacter rubrisoli]|uniref:Cytokinin riboside 5'-monophosphate phosphoribohydrolase n=1 Tax=Ktedonosporobacter rubrisoli TaxID=2509675 RepID=A0A4P6JTD2_KTERU|nr:TIGR00730 family Rossman fold protein [Ktedonosporobacter rubrisoli]QBD78575.1 TIGR00730 family Rossman fold protein [Ktedonosporobacter rubrisoli]
MKHICVFSGSNPGLRQEYQLAAQALGQELVARDLGLIYGGASVGLMGIIADTVLAAGGEVIGVLPRGLFKREIGHSHLTELYQVESMHERKAKMADLANGFIALPGGFGTFDELFEITTWAQIGLHSKPIGLLNIAGYFDPLLALVDHAVAEGFIPEGHKELLLCKDTSGELLEAFATFKPTVEAKWMDTPPAR